MDLTRSCFLCKSDICVTKEHVFPQWLLDDYNLRDKFILLKNGTKIKYGNITVPCCKDCNTKHLSIVENLISKAVRNKDISVLKENTELTSLWLYKLMYGLNYKEIFLKQDLKNPKSEMIVNQERFFEKSMFNIFPLFALGKLQFKGFYPFSIFIFSLSEIIDDGYYYVDEPYKMYSSIIIGSIGIVCSFQCDGFIEKDVRAHLNLDSYKSLTLPQFGEFSAFILHLKSRMKMLPNYICDQYPSKLIINIQETDEKNRYEPFDPQKMTEYTTKMFRPLFESLKTLDEHGQPVIKYKSTFLYF